ncbi:MAG TPA: FtsX-like permease family protein, partial [Candidatus Deferrimicrobium sp.]|nr:FtsX-like permease family protein [Candidatus Deferrimicrobium sp.]
DDHCDNVCSGQVIMEDKTLANQGNAFLQKFSMKKYEDLRQKLQNIAGIKRIGPIIFEEADFIYTYTNEGKTFMGEGPLRVLGIQPGQAAFVPEIQRTITEPLLLDALEKSGTQQAIISEELYRKIFPAIPPGAVEPVTANKKIILELKNDNTQPGRKIELSIAGTFKLGMHKISENMIITSLETAQRIFAMEGQATFVGVSLADPYRARDIADKIKESTIDDHLLIYHWMAVAADMFNSLSFYRKIVIVVLFMSILITAFNIYTTLNIMILERKKQIGILMSMGIKKVSLYRTFLIISQIEAAVGTAIGILAGVILGYAFSGYLNRSLEAFVHIQDAGTVLHPGTAVFIYVFVCLLCGLTALWATRKGANLAPVEALRSE